MTTSRTGTAQGKRFRKDTLRQALSQGLTHCPDCGTQLAWGTSRLPASPEADHIIPHSHGGTDTQDNGRVICRHCNQSRGNKPVPAHKRQPVTPKTTTTLIRW